MRLFGWELRRVKQDAPQQDVAEQFIEAADAVNAVWARARAENVKIGPWIDWPEKQMVVVEYCPTRVIKKVEKE